MSTAITEMSTRRALRREKWKLFRHMKLLYVMMIVPIVGLIIFRYVPIYGIIIAFKDYRFGRGIVGSDWNNFEHFRFLFQSHYFVRILRNTIVISFLKLAVGFPGSGGSRNNDKRDQEPIP